MAILKCPECGSTDLTDMSEPDAYLCQDCGCIGHLGLIRLPIEVKLCGTALRIYPDYRTGRFELRVVEKESVVTDICGFASDADLVKLSRLKDRRVEIVIREADGGE